VAAAEEKEEEERQKRKKKPPLTCLDLLRQQNRNSEERTTPRASIMILTPHTRRTRLLLRKLHSRASLSPDRGRLTLLGKCAATAAEKAQLEALLPPLLSELLRAPPSWRSAPSS
jgi:hypothetical protein